MSNEETQLLLYVFYASDGKRSEINHTYAGNENGAKVLMSAWMAEQVTLGREDIQVKHWPGGFKPGHRVSWPGSIPASQFFAESEASHATTE